MKDLSTIITSSLTKKELTSNAAVEAKQIIEEGRVSALETGLAVKKVIDYATAFYDNLKEGALTEAEKYSSKGFELHGAKFQVKEAGVTWKFDSCGDPEWDKLNAEIKSLTEKKKQREDFLKTLKQGLNTFDEESGETFTIHPPIKSSSTSLAITY